MNILYIGDVMASSGVRAVEKVLPGLRKEKHIDLVIAQAENVTFGKSMSPDDMKVLMAAGVDFFTGGNHTPSREDIKPLLQDENQPVIGPANMRECPGKGWKYANTPKGKVLVVSLLGKIVGKDASTPVDNPFQTIDSILKENEHIEKAATVVNIHGDFSSEKVVTGYYLDGKVTAAVGDHWHVPTADAMILPDGTAHITDVGMCGVLHSSLGVKLSTVIPRWRDGTVNRNELETEGPLQFNAVLIETNEQTGLAKSIEHIQKILT